MGLAGRAHHLGPDRHRRSSLRPATPGGGSGVEHHADGEPRPRRQRPLLRRARPRPLEGAALDRRSPRAVLPAPRRRVGVRQALRLLVGPGRFLPGVGFAHRGGVGQLGVVGGDARCRHRHAASTSTRSGGPVGHRRFPLRQQPLLPRLSGRARPVHRRWGRGGCLCLAEGPSRQQLGLGGGGLRRQRVHGRREGHPLRGVGALAGTGPVAGALGSTSGIGDDAGGGVRALDRPLPALLRRTVVVGLRR